MSRVEVAPPPEVGAEPRLLEAVAADAVPEALALDILGCSIWPTGLLASAFRYSSVAP